MTERIYYQDSYAREFQASVIAVHSTDRGRMAELDRTAFYPASGGQPDDQGWLGLARVLEVTEDDSGKVLHLIEGELPLGPVQGSLDWERRFDHMQQHTGQHLLSQAFVQIAGARTLSFHLGKDVSTIDVEIAELSNEAIDRVVAQANSLVYENRPVQVKFFGPDEVPGLGLRKEPQRAGELRIIEIEGYDRSACGGTHLRHTGELGMVQICGTERYKSNYRIGFVCGLRALRLFGRQQNILKQLGTQLSTGLDELPAVVQKMALEIKESTRSLRDLSERLVEYEAELLFQTAEHRGDVWVVKGILSSESSDKLKFLAAKLLKKGPAVVMLATQSEPALAILANSSPLHVDSGKLLGEVLRSYGGRGGGRPDLAQGGGIPAGTAAQLLETLYQRIFIQRP
jgi:alanyl-tRNA synthetase